MDDASYTKGVTAYSVVAMMEDIGRALHGYKGPISTPRPVFGIAPVSHICLFGDNKAPRPLSGDTTGTSRRSYGFHQSRNINEQRDSTTNDDPIDDIGSIIHDIQSQIDSMTEGPPSPYEVSVNEIESDKEEIMNTPQDGIESTNETPVYTDPVPITRRRRRVV